MVPRRGSRKPRLTRMDAAIDAMHPFGFSEELVRQRVKALLKEYGGDDGWPFIEADAYKLLIDTILDVEEEGDEGEKCNEEDAGPSVVALPPISSELAEVATLTVETEGSSLLRPSIGDAECWKDINLPQNCYDKGVVDYVSGQKKQLDKTPLHSPPSTVPSPLPANSSPIRRRKPCHGWISSDDDEDDFVELTPAIRSKPANPPGQPQNRTTPGMGSEPIQSPGQLENRTSGYEKRHKRKTRWDEGPECT
ncbi:hypothetical protein U1Q18_022318 [Sarracenia purpurea var. burkii]